MLDNTDVIEAVRAVATSCAAVFFGFYAAGHLGDKVFGDVALLIGVLTIYGSRKRLSQTSWKTRRRGLGFWTMCLAIFLGIAFGIHALRTAAHPNFEIGILLALLSGTASLLSFARIVRG